MKIFWLNQSYKGTFSVAGLVQIIFAFNTKLRGGRATSFENAANTVMWHVTGCHVILYTLSQIMWYVNRTNTNVSQILVRPFLFVVKIEEWKLSMTVGFTVDVLVNVGFTYTCQLQKWYRIWQMRNDIVGNVYFKAWWILSMYKLCKTALL